MKNLIVAHLNTVLAIILILQIIFCLIVGMQKDEFHIDEIYSYILSNSFDADRISNADWMWDQWISGEEFNEFVTVQDGEQFDYKTVYLNNSTDCHPPLYYWLLHTICSFFPEHFNKWFGLGLNILFFIASAILIYKISDEIIKDSVLKIMPLFLFGFSKLAIDTVTFIRMYMLLEFFAIILVYLHIKLLKYGITKKRLFAVWIIIFLGAMTQYYSLVLSFWSVLIFSIYLLREKEIKEMFIYALGALISVVMMLLCYPFALTQATGSATNNVGREVAETLFDIKLWFSQTFNLACSFAKSLSSHRIISIVLLLMLSVLFLVLTVSAIRRKVKIEHSKEFLWLLSVLILTFLSISYIGGHYVYIRYVYFISSLVYIIVIACFEPLILNEKTKKIFIAFCLVFVVIDTLHGMILGGYDYVYKESGQQTDNLSNYSDISCIVVCGGNKQTSIPTGNLTRLRKFDNVYMSDEEHFIENKEILNANPQYVAYICTDVYWTEGLIPEEFFNKFLPENYKYQYLCDGSLGKYYLIEAAY